MSTVIRTAAAVLLSLAAGMNAFAQDAPANFCENNPGFDDWDFWVGEWDVFGNTDERPRAGTNSIEKHYANCLITETWESVSGNGGFSINYYNSVRDQWRQVWVANGYSIDYSGGLNDQGQMVLEGEIDNYAAGSSSPFRGIWAPLENGDVLQRFEVYDEAAGEWKVWFEGRYVRRH